MANSENKEFIDSIRAARQEIFQLEHALSTTSDTLKANQEQFKKGKKSLDDYHYVLNKLKNDYKDNFKSLTDAIKKQKEHQKQQELVRKAIEHSLDPLKKYESALRGIGQLGGGIDKAASGLIKLAGAGVSVGFSFSELSSTILEYNKNLYIISRTQQVAGKGYDDMAGALEYVKKNTLMSSMAFTKLAASIQSTFIGVKPSMMEIARLLKTWGEQTGYDYDSFKKLAEVQASFPPLFTKWASGLESIRRINESKGMGTEQEEKRLDLTRMQTIALLDATGQMRELGTTALTTLTLQTASQKELMATEAARQEGIKQMQDLQLKFSKQFQPVLKQILSISSGILKVLNGYGNTIAIFSGMTLAVVGVTKGLLAFRKMMAAAKEEAKLMGVAFKTSLGAVGIILTAVGAIATAWSYFSDRAEEQKNQMKEIGETAKKQNIIYNERKKLTADEQKKYQAMWDAEKGSTKTIDEQLALHKEIEDNLGVNLSSVEKMYVEYDKVRTSIERQIGIFDAIDNGLKSVVSVTEEFGGRAQDALELMVKMSNLKLDEQAVLLNASLVKTKGAIEEILGKKITIDLGGNLEAQLSAYKKMIEASGKPVEDQKIAYDMMLKLTEDIGKQKELEGQRQKKINDLTMVDVRQMEKSTVLAESRLATERKLMESAQFGMGASVEMMQKQVDLAYKMEKTYDNALKTQREMAKAGGKVKENDIQRIENLGTAAEAEDYIKNTLGKTGDEAIALTNHWEQYQKITQKSMEQQQKIYDLTKDIREGYLDAIREMSTGAGEFEKIIGTQEMGVTQLMGAVKDVTGVAKLNSMALGGLQEKTLGAGKEITGQYGAEGIGFIGKDAQEARNARIWNYGRSRDQAEAAMRGESTGGAPGVGTGVVPGVERYLGPEQEAQIKGEVEGAIIADAIADVFSVDVLAKGFHAGFKKSMRDPQVQRDYTKVVNEGVRVGNAPGMEQASKIQGGGPAGVLGTNVLNKSPVGDPAGGGPVGIFGERIPYTRFARDASGSTYIGRTGTGFIGETGGSGQKAGTGQEGETGKKRVTRSPLIDKRNELNAKIREEQEKANKALKKSGYMNVKVLKDKETRLNNDVKQKTVLLTLAKQDLKIAQQDYEDADWDFSGVGQISPTRAYSYNKAFHAMKEAEEKSQAAAYALEDAEKAKEKFNTKASPILKGFETVQEDTAKSAEISKQLALEYKDQQIKATEEYARSKKESEINNKRQEALQKETARASEQGVVGGVWYGAGKNGEAIKKLERNRLPSGIYGDKPTREGYTTIGGSEGGQAVSEEARQAGMIRAKKDQGVQSLRAGLGTVRPQRGESQEQAEFKKATSYFLQQHVEQWAQKDVEAAREKLGGLAAGQGRGGKIAAMGASAIDSIATAGKKTSALADIQRGGTASDADMAAFQQQSGYMAEALGATGEGEGGGGAAVITIKLSPGLQEEMVQSKNLRVNIVRASSS